jgi:hypothetical protein
VNERSLLTPSLYRRNRAQVVFHRIFFSNARIVLKRRLINGQKLLLPSNSERNSQAVAIAIIALTARVTDKSLSSMAAQRHAGLSIILPDDLSLKALQQNKFAL